MPAASLNFSPLMCVPLPLPAEAKLSAPGFCFAAATRSATVLMLVEGATTSTFGCPASGTISMKSLHRVVGQVRVDRRVVRVRRRMDEQRVAVGRRLRDDRARRSCRRRRAGCR